MNNLKFVRNQMRESLKAILWIETSSKVVTSLLKFARKEMRKSLKRFSLSLSKETSSKKVLTTLYCAERKLAVLLRQKIVVTALHCAERRLLALAPALPAGEREAEGLEQRGGAECVATLIAGLARTNPWQQSGGFFAKVYQSLMAVAFVKVSVVCIVLSNTDVYPKTAVAIFSCLALVEH